jgi:multiple sugar transport system substrate-binding protein
MSLRKFHPLMILVILAMLVGVTGVSAQAGKVEFLSTQFNTVDETAKINEILTGFDGEVDFVGSEEQDMFNALSAEAGQDTGSVDVVGALHGSFPTLVKEDVLFDLSGLLESLQSQVEIAPAFVELGKMGTTDFQYYIPWMQATYIMAANKDALQYLPEGADINALTWQQLADWGKNIKDATGEAKLGFPVNGLWHRFLEGYLFPSFTGGMVTKFNSPEAVDMMTFLRDDLWPYVNPQSITYEFMQEPLLSGEVWVAFDHTARLIDAFNQQPDQFVAFPAPAGPAGRGFMPVVVGLGVPANAPNPDGAVALIQFLMMPETQGAVLRDLAFFPVVSGVDMSGLPAGVALEAGAVTAQANSPDALPALLPVGLGDRGGEINTLYRETANHILLDGEDIQTALDEGAASLQALLNDTGAACWPPDPPSEGACQIQ